MILLWLRNEIDVEIFIVVLIIQKAFTIYGMKLIVYPSLVVELAKCSICYSKQALVPFVSKCRLKQNHDWNNVRSFKTASRFA